MNGNAPPPNSREIIAMTAYIAWLSRGAVVGTGFSGQGFVKVHPAHAPDKANGAGMNTNMSSFVRSNMPANAPGSLSDQQAADVSAYVLSHPRPQFVPDRTVTFPSVPAKYF